MLPVNSIKLQRAHELVHGELAILKDYSDALVLVGTVNEFVVATYLDPADKKCNSTVVSELAGAAISIGGFEFEVDETSCEKLELMDAPINSLAVKGGDLLLIAVPPSNHGHVAIIVGSVDADNSRIVHAFRRWRLVHRDGDRERVLFEKAE